MKLNMKDEDYGNLANHGFCVVPNFVGKPFQDALRSDLLDLHSGGHFQLAKIGHDGMVQSENTPFKDVRFSETCFIGRATAATEENKGESLPPSNARADLHDLLDALRSQLQSNAIVRGGSQTAGIPPLDAHMEELMYAYYPNGGYYRRHRDAESNSISTLRKYSFLLYLNDQDWNVDTDGGQLRIHRDSGGDTLPIGELPNFVDVDPKGGTLVVFRSDLCPHEVMDTQRERYAIVGWFLSEAAMMTTATASTRDGSSATLPVNSSSTTPIHPEVLTALQDLMQAAPKLAAKLKPTPPPSSNGMLGDDFSLNFPGFGMPAAAPPPQQQQPYKEADALYWKKIASFDLSGRVTTLSLGSNRLHSSISALANPILLQHLITLDIASTDLTPADILQILEHSLQLKHLHLGGNGLGGEGMEELKPTLQQLLHLNTLDLRYNDMGPRGAAVIGSLLNDETSSTASWNTLYLEGNQLGDDGILALTAKIGMLREVYLGQNEIGPAGAATLAKALQPRMKKLYIEGNRIGNDGANALSAALEKQPSKTLEKLYADLNGIGKDESLRLGRAVNSMTMVGNGALQD